MLEIFLQNQKKSRTRQEVAEQKLLRYSKGVSNVGYLKNYLEIQNFKASIGILKKSRKELWSPKQKV